MLGMLIHADVLHSIPPAFAFDIYSNQLCRAWSLWTLVLTSSGLPVLQLPSRRNALSAATALVVEPVSVLELGPGSPATGLLGVDALDSSESPILETRYAHRSC